MFAGKTSQGVLLNCRESVLLEARSWSPETDGPFWEPRNPAMRMAAPFFLPRVRKVVRDEEVAVIFLKEFWPRFVGDRVAGSTVPRRLHKRTMEIGVPAREWERALRVPLWDG